MVRDVWGAERERVSVARDVRGAGRERVSVARDVWGHGRSYCTVVQRNGNRNYILNPILYLHLISVPWECSLEQGHEERLYEVT